MGFCSVVGAAYHALIPVDLAADEQLRSQEVSVHGRDVGHRDDGRAALDAALRHRHTCRHCMRLIDAYGSAVSDMFRGRDAV